MEALGVRNKLDQFLHTVALFQQLFVGRFHTLAAEIVDRQALHDLVVAILTGDRKAVDDAGGNSIAAVRGHAHAGPVAIGSSLHPIAHVIDCG